MADEFDPTTSSQAARMYFERVSGRSPFAGEGPRLGVLHYKRDKTLSTPNFIATTSRGVVPHVTPDMMMDETDIEGVYVAIEDFLEKTSQPAPSVMQCPAGEAESKLRNFIGLPDEQLLVLGARRAPPLTCPMSNTNDAVATSTSVGFQMLRVDEYARVASTLNPDIVVAPGDISFGVKPGHRKLDKMVSRTERWVQETTSVMTREGNFPEIAVFAPILPIEAEPQSWYLEMLANDLLQSLSGLAVYDSDVLPDLPKPLETLPRLLMTEPSSPHRILRDISLGADICTIPLLGSATDAGLALSFTMKTIPIGDGRQALAVDMRDPSYATDLSPLVDGCECYGCRVHHRAYMQHLLSAKEMLAWVLLQVHNLRTMVSFFEDIRESIAAGTFEQDSEAFSRAYESDLPSGSGQGPRMRGYQYRSEGPNEVRRNAPAYKSLDALAGRIEDAPLPDVNVTANALMDMAIAKRA